MSNIAKLDLGSNCELRSFAFLIKIFHRAFQSMISIRVTKGYFKSQSFDIGIKKVSEKDQSLSDEFNAFLK